MHYANAPNKVNVTNTGYNYSKYCSNFKSLFGVKFAKF